MAAVKRVFDQDAWDAWVSERPECIRAMMATHPPTLLYRMKSTGQRCTIVAYNEDGTVRVDISGKYNLVVFGREVFGIPLDDLVECDLPEEGELVGDTHRITKFVRDVDA